MATESKTAWGSSHVYLGEVSSTSVFPKWDTLEDIGTLLADSLTLETADGDVSEVKDVNGILVDKLTKEPTYTLGFKVIKPSKEHYSKFWETFTTSIAIDDDTTESATGVKSFVSTKQYAVLLANINAVGSEYTAIGKCSLTAKLTWSASEGYGVECSAEFLKGYNNSVINIGTLTEDGATVLKTISNA